MAFTAATGASAVKTNNISTTVAGLVSAVVALSNTSNVYSATGTWFRKINGTFQAVLAPQIRHYGAVYSWRRDDHRFKLLLLRVSNLHPDPNGSHAVVRWSGHDGAQARADMGWCVHA